ncbi:MAG: enolase C-terminal domain-like protein [Candidatus Latescibacterota bacterium]|nr:enolase C-terminal domain-like protein [Candidatus Latescibacterota bacterium]
MTPEKEKSIVEERMEELYAERIECIEKVTLRGRRPRKIGYNARIPTHGPRISDPVVRLRTIGGGMGIGWSRLQREQAEQLIGRSVGELFRLPEGSLDRSSPVDLVMWDLVARLLDMPLYRLLGARGSREVTLYDGSIYIDDLERDNQAARQIFRDEVASGQEHGYAHFKVKVGRGARWMRPEEGLARDALVVHTVREAAGPDAHVLIDANMGNTLNSACQLLEAVADARVLWFEEPFAEDRPLNQALKEFILDNGWGTLVADGEFAPPPYFFDLVREGWIDIVQQDFHAYGLTWWRRVAAEIEPWEARCAPHTWGSYIERFAHAHFAASIPNYLLLEAAPAHMPGVVLDGWEMRDGNLFVPDTPGTGFDVEPSVFAQAMEDSESFRVAA